MGNQGHATEGARLTNEWIQAGVIGPVREVHVWSDRAGRLWKQGIGRPKETPPVPSTLDWDLWLGPVHARPYHPAYAPVSWRGWRDFGTGALGDMGCHIIDHPVWALDSVRRPPSRPAPRSTAPSSRRQAELRDLSDRRDHLLRVPGRGDLPPVRMTWYEGGSDAAGSAGIARGARTLPDNGVLYIGSKGKMYHGSHGGMPELLRRRSTSRRPRSPGR